MKLLTLLSVTTTVSELSLSDVVQVIPVEMAVFTPPATFVALSVGVSATGVTLMVMLLVKVLYWDTPSTSTYGVVVVSTSVMTMVPEKSAEETKKIKTKQDKR